MNAKNTRNAMRTQRARELRSQNTKSEKLLWAMLRGSQLCGLKFRRQHPIGPYFADFACESQHTVVEIDGGYHDAVVEDDLKRMEFLIQSGWRVLRFSDQEVEENVEAVAHAIARRLRLKFEWHSRGRRGAGMMHSNAPPGPKRSM